jgi:hypothetical protein
MFGHHMSFGLKLSQLSKKFCLNRDNGEWLENADHFDELVMKENPTKIRLRSSETSYLGAFFFG